MIVVQVPPVAAAAAAERGHRSAATHCRARVIIPAAQPTAAGAGVAATARNVWESEQPRHDAAGRSGRGTNCRIASAARSTGTAAVLTVNVNVSGTMGLFGQ